MNSDAFFAIGSTHKICEDYAVAGKIGHINYAIVSDGCSSSADTDIGARMLVKALQQTLATGRDVESYIASMYAALHVAYSSVKVLGMEPNVLDATLGVIIADGRKVIALLAGDGVVAVHRNANWLGADDGGSITFHKIDYKSNAPRYLSYTLDPSRQANYEREFGSEKIWFQDTMDPSVSYADGPKLVDDEILVVVNEIDNSQLSSDEIMTQSIAIFSDGIFSFSGPDKPSLKRVITDCMSFKNTKGEFVRRRCKRALKDYAAKGVVHQDDFSMAAIYFEHFGGQMRSDA